MTFQRTHLYDRHVALGAKMVPFGGWEMPLHYPTGTVHEHLTCRRDAVVFDVSHLGTLRCTGPGTFDRLQAALTNDLRKIAPGRAQYTHLLNEQGGVVDDIIVWWVSDEEFDVMPNATNTAGVGSVLPGIDVTSGRTLLAVQGPHARRKVAMIDATWAQVPRFGVVQSTFEGASVRIAGTGYTGEDGLEIAIDNDHGAALWGALLAAGITPAGLGARDTLRLEAGLPLYGHELSLESTTLEAGLGWVLGWTKENFIGRAAALAERERGPARHLRALWGTGGRQPLRDGAEVFIGEELVGVVTSGNYSPLAERGIGFALLSQPLPVGTAVDIRMRGRTVPGSVTSFPVSTPNTEEDIRG